VTRTALALLAACAPPAVIVEPPVREPPAVLAYQLGKLRVEGAPPVDETIARALAPYDAASASRLLDLADDGQGVLVLSHGIAVEVRAGAEPVPRITELDVEWARFATDGALVATADRDGDEEFALYRQDPGRAPPALLGGGRHTDAILDRDRRRIVWASPDALWIGGSDGSARRFFASDGQWTPLDLSADGRFVLARHLVSITSSALYRIDVTTGDAIALTPVAPDVASPWGRFGNGAVYAISTGPRDRAGLWELAPRRATLLTPDLAWEVTALAVSGDGATVAFVTNEDGVSVLHLYDAQTRQHRVPAGAPSGGLITDLRFAASAPVLGLSWVSPRHPRDAYTLDLATGRLDAWTTASAPEHLVDPVHVAIASGAVSVPALVYKPAAARAPVIVDLHGGPEDQWVARYAGFEQFLVARGYAIVQPNVRGSVGYGAAYSHLDDGMRRGDVVRDVGAVLDWIATQPDLDANHVFAMGSSYGGYLVLASLLAYPERLRGGIDMVGIADFVTFLEGTAGYRRDQRRAEYGDERDPVTRAYLASISPLARASELRRPLLVAQGTRDPRVPAADAARLVQAVRLGGRDAWYLVAEDEGHGFTRVDNRMAFEALVTQFLDRFRRDP
jgi:dienelactone hydrolase